MQTGLVLASSEGANTDTMISLTVILLTALMAPILHFMVRKKIPAVVFLIVGGIVIGPHVWGLAEIDSGISILRQLGLGMLFLLAGFELDIRQLRSKQGRNASVTWFLCMAIGLLGAVVFAQGEGWLEWVTLAIAVSSTALGTLVPILKGSGQLKTPVGNSVMIHGAIGELYPIMAIALLLSARSTWMTVLILLAFFAIAVLVAMVPRTIATIVPWVGKAIIEGASQTGQTTVRMVLLMLSTLMTVAAVFQLDVVLGAFATGIMLRQIVPEGARHHIEERLDVVGYGFFIPLFFICSGMGINVQAVTEGGWLLLGVVGTIIIARGVPVYLREKLFDTGSGLTTEREKISLALYAATGLPIIVAVTEVAESAGLLSEERGSLLVAGGALTVLVFPFVAQLVGGKNGGASAAETTGPVPVVSVDPAPTPGAVPAVIPPKPSMGDGEGNTPTAIKRNPKA